MVDEFKSQENGSLSRRTFISGGTVAGVAALGLWNSGCDTASAPDPAKSVPAGEDLGAIPRRALGKTDAMVSILGLGTACMGEGPQNAGECAAVFAEAIDRGINYVDTARIYGDAETALGMILPSRRDRVFLVTKCMTNSAAEAQKSFEQSLLELKVDHVDLLHLHAAGDRDLDQVLGPGGAWEHLLKMKQAGKTRFIGITGHSRPPNFIRMLDTGQVDVLMVAMNFVDRHTYGFEDKVLPKARQRRPAQMEASVLPLAVRYSLNLEGVTGVVLGVHDAEELRRNIGYVINAPKLTPTEVAALEEQGKRLAQVWGPRFGPVA